MRFLLLSLALLALRPDAWGQERLMMYPSFGAVHFEYEKDTLAYQVTPKQVSQILFELPEAHHEFKVARTHSTLSGICGSIGFALILFPTATAALGGSNPEWGMAAGGAALVLGSIPLSRSYRRKAQHALDLFNRRHTAFVPRPYFKFWGTGGSLILRF